MKEGDLFRVECLDWTGGQIKDDDSAEDVKKVGGQGGGSSARLHNISLPARLMPMDRKYVTALAFPAWERQLTTAHFGCKHKL